MPTGTPISIKCPKCKRGKWGHDRNRKGVQAVGCEVKPTRSQHAGHGNGGSSFYGHRSIVCCLDCGHTWPTTLYTWARIDWTKCVRPDCDCRPSKT
jgi:hypothetical protein